MATAAEHELVKKKGGIPHRYETGLERIIHYCLRKPLKVVARDYACAPALDDPDENDRRILRDLRRLGVIDSFKVSKKSVDYGFTRFDLDLAVSDARSHAEKAWSEHRVPEILRKERIAAFATLATATSTTAFTQRCACD